MNHALVRVLTGCAAGLALTSTACSGGPSTATPPPSTGAAVGGASTRPDTDALVGVKPCDLLTGAEAESLGLGASGEADEVGSADTCLWSATGKGGVTVGVRPEQGFDDLDYTGDPTTPVELGKFDGVRVEAPNGGKGTCHVVIDVADSASVQIAAHLRATSTDTAAACERAVEAAELVAAKLP
ncbi:DUF3558 family protein [Saccharothrix coeruleofusca]|uniref:DUF3558 domain-containing protein n=1 Tax=Saccharothrix coeruleofusca TaxID=33919 RepID=A0A918AQZ3_9PSEU|nr:DUF3558 family protein [Saccharothrix coeruleofusca]GGP73139.1 hypothetical protein GCM10010185_53260 [Saccharothrix coeruleofusca]